MLSFSGAEMPFYLDMSASAGRVPIKDIRKEMERDAPASVRVPRNTTSSDDSKPSLQALLSDSKQDWLISEKDLEIAVDERGKAIKLGSGAFGTVSSTPSTPLARFTPVSHLCCTGFEAN